MVTTAGHGSIERERVLEVAERRAEAAQQARQQQRHPQLLRPRGQLDGLDPLRNELGMTGDGCDPQAGLRRERCECAQEVEDVRLVAGAAAAEHVGVDDDERLHVSSRQTVSTASATARQE